MSIEIKNLSFAYGPKQRKILHDVSVTVRDGELFSVIGPNGCGKTTLVKCINLINKYQDGSILLNGRNVKDFRQNELASQIGYVPQMNRDTFSGTVMDVVLLGRYPHIGWKPSQRDIDLSFEVLQKLDIVELANFRYEQLSGGQRQKVLIARALAQEPDVFLFDEPTSYLDIGNQLEIMSMARKLADSGKTVIIVVHDLNMARHYSDRIALFKAGQLVSCGTGADVLTKEHIKTVYGVDTEIEVDGYIRLWK